MYVEWMAHVIGLFHEAEGRLPESLDEVFARKLPSGRRGDPKSDLFGNAIAYDRAEDGTSFTLTSLGKDGKPGGEGLDADARVGGGSSAKD